MYVCIYCVEIGMQYSIMQCNIILCNTLELDTIQYVHIICMNACTVVFVYVCWHIIICTNAFIKAFVYACTLAIQMTSMQYNLMHYNTLKQDTIRCAAAQHKRDRLSYNHRHYTAHKFLGWSAQQCKWAANCPVTSQGSPRMLPRAVIMALPFRKGLRCRHICQTLKRRR